MAGGAAVNSEEILQLHCLPFISLCFYSLPLFFSHSLSHIVTVVQLADSPTVLTNTTYRGYHQRGHHVMGLW